MTKTRRPFDISINGFLAAGWSPREFAGPAPLHPAWPKVDLERGALCAPAERKREASLPQAQQYNRFCGA
jgi:hypothetical protein